MDKAHDFNRVKVIINVCVEESGNENILIWFHFILCTLPVKYLMSQVQRNMQKYLKISNDIKPKCNISFSQLQDILFMKTVK